MRSVGKLYLRLFEGVSSVSLKKDESLINGFHSFYADDYVGFVMDILGRWEKETGTSLNLESLSKNLIIP